MREIDLISFYALKPGGFSFVLSRNSSRFIGIRISRILEFVIKLKIWTNSGIQRSNPDVYLDKTDDIFFQNYVDNELSIL